MKHDGIKGIIESGQAPGLKGLKKGGKNLPSNHVSGRHSVEILRPRPYDDAKAQLTEAQDKGVMTPELEAHGRKLLDGLKDDKAAGKHNVDYWDKGHPMERDNDPREGILDE